MARHKQQLHGGRAEDRSVPLRLRLMRFLFSRLGGVFPHLLGAWAFRLWFRTRRYPESAAGKRAASEAVREVLTVNNIPVVIYRWGRVGPRVFFVHGWSGRGSQVAAFVGPLIDAGFQVVALDLPGHGATPGKSTNMVECATVLDALDKKYGPMYAAITHSFGGMVLAYALNHGIKLERAVMISAPADIDFLLESFAGILSLHTDVIDDLWQRLEQRFSDQTSDRDFSERISLVNNIGQIDTPALVIHDEHDHSVPLTQGQRIAATWPDARLMRTSGLGHARILRDRQVIDTVIGFLSQQ